MAKTDLKLGRLTVAMRTAREQLKYQRARMREAVREYAGPNWSENGEQKSVPVNLLALYVKIMSRSLVAKNPRVLLSTFKREHKPLVATMQQWLNDQIPKMRLVDTLQRSITDALFSMGMVQVSLATPADAANKAWNLRAGEPFAQSIDFEDAVFDVRAKRFEHVSFIGHRIRLPLAAVQKDKSYDAAARKRLVASENIEFDELGTEKVSALGQGYYGDEDYEEMVEMWQVYLPRHRVVVTLADTESVEPDPEPLKVQPWVGPDTGPYHVFGFDIVPANILPKAPIQDLVDLHEAANQSYRKMIRSVQRMKELTVAGAGREEDLSAIMKANDGEVIPLSEPQGIMPMVFGGEHVQKVVAIATALKDLFVYAGGNLDAAGGLAPQAKTLGQDKLLAVNSSRTVADMQDRAVQHVTDVCGALCWYYHHHPTKVMETRFELEGLPGMGLDRNLGPDRRRMIPFEALQIKVDPYSIQHTTPQERMATMQTIVQQIVMPMMGLLQQQGVGFDLHKYLAKVSEYLDQPDLAEILTIVEPVQGSGGDTPQTAKPANTTREYVRHNTSEAREQSSNKNLVTSMLGVDTGGAQEKAERNGTYGK